MIKIPCGDIYIKITTTNVLLFSATFVAMYRITIKQFRFIYLGYNDATQEIAVVFYPTYIRGETFPLHCEYNGLCVSITKFIKICGIQNEQICGIYRENMYTCVPNIEDFSDTPCFILHTTVREKTGDKSYRYSNR